MIRSDNAKLAYLDRSFGFGLKKQDQLQGCSYGHHQRIIHNIQ